MKDMSDFMGAAILGLIVLAGLFWYIAAHPAPHTGAPVGTVATTTDKTLMDHEQYYTIDAVYPASTPLLVSAGTEANAAAVASIAEFVATTTAQFKEENNLDHLTADDIATQNLGGDVKYALGIDYKTYTSAHTLSYVFQIYADTLGAHPNGYYQTFTFDTSSGQELELADLFTPGSDYLDELSSMTRASLNASLGDNALPDFIDPGTTPDANNFSNFALDGSDLVIIFPPYAVGPYAIGTQTVRIPLSQLSGVLKSVYQ